MIRESEDLSEQKAYNFADGSMPLDLEDKKGTSPDRFNFGPGIFFAPGPECIFYLGKEAKNEEKVFGVIYYVGSFCFGGIRTGRG